MRPCAAAIVLLVAAAPSVARADATVLHAPPGYASRGDAISLVAVVDDAWSETDIVLRYRAAGDDAFIQVSFQRSSVGGYHAVIPARAVRPPGVEYYIAGVLPDGGERLHFASAEAPHRVRVEVPPGDRWVGRELARIHHRRNHFGLVVEGQDFDNRFGNRDRYVRGEATWTYRLVSRLYSFHLGYGFIEGETPRSEAPDTTSRKEGARYGFGGVRLRLHESFYVDGRALLGFSRDGFIVGASTQVTLGKPHRSSVNLGAELLEDLRGSLWIRLQWDTVPPMLMGASIIKTDLPGATLTGGSFIQYDASYPITDRIWVGGKLSYGSRDGPGFFGGGVTTSVDF